MQSVDILYNEHRVIEKALNLLEKINQKLHNDENVDIQKIEGLLDFFINFADGCHHLKEENSLFPVLERKGISGPTFVMTTEHQEGKKLILKMKELLPNIKENREDFLEASNEYVELLRQHIWKEDNVLFNMAKNVLSTDEDITITNEFKKLQCNSKHDYYHNLIEKMEI